MALVYTPKSKTVPGGSTYSTVVITGDTSYPTGGTVIDATKLNLAAGQIKSVIDVRPFNVAACAWQPVMVEVTDGRTITSLKMQMVVVSTGAEVAAAANLSTGQWTLIFAGN